MAVSPGQAAAFGAQMQDNGNAIALPEGSSFLWTTDDPTDVIAPSAAAPDNSAFADITVSDPPATGRTTLTVTAGAVAPDGTNIEGSVTVDITAAVGHTFTIVVSQLTVNPLGRSDGGPRRGKPTPKK
jgi:hypothetical protein